jgi:PPM family protein phosphatase
VHPLDYGAVTDRGTVRATNEDSILAAPPVFVVADGIGGSEGGEVASSIVVQAFSQVAVLPVIEADAVGAAIQAAHTRIRELNGDHRNGPGSTAVGAVGVMSGDEPYWVVFNVGDSRIYRLPVDEPEDGRRAPVQISVDHSHVQELVDAGVITPDEAAEHPDRNLVTRAVGSETACEPDFWMIPMVPGDRWLICSDGLFDELADEVIADRLLAPISPDETAHDLLRMALESGASDNVSVIVVDVLSGGAESAPASEETTAQPHPNHARDGAAGGDPSAASEPEQRPRHAEDLVQP